MSNAVARALQEIERFERQRAKYLRRFRSLPRQELANRLSIRPSLETLLRRTDRVPAIVTVSVGLPELLPDAFALTNPASSPVDILLLDDIATPSDSANVQFFHAPARLRKPPGGLLGNGALLLALIVRPGTETLQLSGACVPAPTTGQDDEVAIWSAEFIREVERVVLAHSDQWFPPGPLWNDPAEVVLPEYASSGADKRS